MLMLRQHSFLKRLAARQFLVSIIYIHAGVYKILVMLESTVSIPWNFDTGNNGGFVLREFQL